MAEKKRLLVIAHTPSDNTNAMAESLLEGACDSEIENVKVRCLAPLETQPDDINACDGLIIGTTENLGYMAGLTKDLFDRCFYECVETSEGLPFAFYIRAGHDGTGTRRALESITTGLRWRMVQPPLICRGDWQPDFLEQCRELGLTMAASLDAGIV